MATLLRELVEASETTESYYRARYYDPQTGRFITEDPFRFLAGLNFYAYVTGNPIRYNDPFGFQGQTKDEGWFWNTLNWLFNGLVTPPPPKPGQKPFGFDSRLYNLCNKGQKLLFSAASPVNPYYGSDTEKHTDPKVDAAVSAWRQDFNKKCREAQKPGKSTVPFCGSSLLGPSGPVLACSCCEEDCGSKGK